MTTQKIEESLRREMSQLKIEDLLKFAEDMGVDHGGLDRQGIEDACVLAELYAFTH